MTEAIRRVGVLGAGVMGSGIAAHLASCGIRTLLLDIVPPDLDPGVQERAARDGFALRGVEQALSARPALFLQRDARNLIETGNLEDHLEQVHSCDWIIEVVREDLSIKRALLARLESVWRPGTLVSTNTSGLSLAAMLEGRGDAFRQHFCGTHFFNPVRYMHLLEIIPGPDTAPAVLERLSDFADRVLGKGVVYAKDTPNFIANRIGVYSMMSTIHRMAEMGYTIEEVDAIAGPPMGRPRSAAFRTADVVGLDTFVHVAQNCFDALVDDPERDVFAIPEFLHRMVDAGLLGQKSKAGFYKKEGRDIRTVDLETLTYRDRQRPELPVLDRIKKAGDAAERLRLLVADEGRAGAFAWSVISATLSYAACIADDIADDIADIDRAMRWGFNWDLGPFETWQALGPRVTADRMGADGLVVPAWVDAALEAGGLYADTDRGRSRFVPGHGLSPLPPLPGSLSLAGLERAGAVVERNRGASLLDLGDGIAGLSFHTKMNTVDSDVVAMLQRACDMVEREFDGLVLANEAAHFSAGANLLMIVMHAAQKKWDEIEQIVRAFQQVNQRLKYLARPVVSAPHGLTLGGGAEMALAADAMVMDQETYLGLVEVGVGLIPGGGGTLNLLKRVFQGVPKAANPNEYDRLPLVRRAFETIALAKVSTGAGEVFSLGFADGRDEIAINRDRRVADAKARCRYMADRGYTPPRPAQNLVLPGPTGAAALAYAVYALRLAGHASEHDRLIATRLAHVLCGGDTNGVAAVSESDLLDLEREAFMGLVGEPKTIERMQHMLTTNKPLRN